VRLYQPVKGNKNYNFNWDFFAVSFKYNSVFRYMLNRWWTPYPSIITMSLKII